MVNRTQQPVVEHYLQRSVAERTDMRDRVGEAVVDVPSVQLVLFDEQMLGAAGQRLRDDAGEVEGAGADLGELYESGELPAEPRAIACGEQLERRSREEPDPVVLEMYELHLSGEVAQHVDRVLAAPLYPMDVDLEVQVRAEAPHDVEPVSYT